MRRDFQVQVREVGLQLSSRQVETEAIGLAAYGLPEGTLDEFSLQLIGLLQARALDIHDDDEMAIAEFWDCLQRPAIEWCAQMPLREIVRHFLRGRSGAGVTEAGLPSDETAR